MLWEEEVNEMIMQKRWQRNANDIVLLVVLLLVTFILCGNGYSEREKELIIVTHLVSTGETLWTVAEQYITPDRYMPEFLEGIYELNYDKVFDKREKAGVPRMSVYPGDRLEIRYWKSKEAN